MIRITKNDALIFKRLLEETERYPELGSTMSSFGQRQVHLSKPFSEYVGSTIDLLNDQLNGDHMPDEELLDIVIAQIQSRYGRNGLSGENLGQLRTALLRPSERRSLHEQLAKHEMSCASCGHTFVNSELTYINGDEYGGVTFCLTCVQDANWKACSTSGCKNSVELNQQLKKQLFRKQFCEEHRTKSVGEKVDSKEIISTESINTTGAMWGQVERAQESAFREIAAENAHMGPPANVTAAPMPGPNFARIFTSSAERRRVEQQQIARDWARGVTITANQLPSEPRNPEEPR